MQRQRESEDTKLKDKSVVHFLGHQMKCEKKCVSHKAILFYIQKFLPLGLRN